MRLAFFVLRKVAPLDLKVFKDIKDFNDFKSDLFPRKHKRLPERSKENPPHRWGI